MIRYVLAGPCKVDVPDHARAQELFDACSREASLLSWNTDGSLFHRADIRREMLPLLRQADPTGVDDIHSSAVRYYEQHDDITSWAEELYDKRLPARLRRVAGSALAARGGELSRMSLGELPAEGQVYLAPRLGITLSPDVCKRARVHEQEQYAAARVRQLIRLGELDTALDVIGQQMDRAQNSPSTSSRRRSSKGSAAWARQVRCSIGPAKGLRRLPTARPLLSCSTRPLVWPSTGRDGPGPGAACRSTYRDARTAGPHNVVASVDHRVQGQRTKLRELQLREASSRIQAEAAQTELQISAAQSELLRLVDTAPQEQIALDPTLLVELASEIGEERPTLVLQALLLLGLNDLPSSQAAELAVALAGWDARNDHLPASELRLPTGPGGQTDAWAGWLQIGRRKRPRRHWWILCNRYPNGEPVITVLSTL